MGGTVCPSWRIPPYDPPLMIHPMKFRHFPIAAAGPSGRNAFAALLVLILGGSLGCSRSPNEDLPSQAVLATDHTPEPLAVAVTTARRASWPTTIHVHGSLIPEEVAVLGAKVPGRVASVLVDVGDVVTEKQLLANLDQAQLELEVEHAEAMLAQACAAIGLEPDESTDDLVPDNSPVVRQEKALLEQAEIAFQRTTRLRASGAATEEELTDREAALKVASARYAASLNGLAEKIATIKVRRSEVEVAKNALAESSILAPFDGVVQQRATAAGAYLREGDPVLTLVRCDQVRFLGSVPEKQAPSIRVGQLVEVHLRGTAEPQPVKIDRLRPVLDPLSRALLFEADLPNAQCRLQPGLFAEADVTIDADAEALVVPHSAVVEFAGVEKVWRVTDGKAEEVVVRTGPRRGDHVVIESGLAEGDQILTDGSAGQAGEVKLAGTRY